MAKKNRSSKHSINSGQVGKIHSKIEEIEDFLKKCIRWKNPKMVGEFDKMY